MSKSPKTRWQCAQDYVGEQELPFGSLRQLEAFREWCSGSYLHQAWRLLGINLKRYFDRQQVLNDTFGSNVIKQKQSWMFQTEESAAPSTALCSRSSVSISFFKLFFMVERITDVPLDPPLNPTPTFHQAFTTPVPISQGGREHQTEGCIWGCFANWHTLRM